MTTFLEARFGKMTGVESLQGVAGSGVSRVHFPSISVIVKSSLSGRERKFYEQHSARLHDCGVNVPIVYGSGGDSLGMNWVVLEDIPYPLAKNGWVGNTAQLQILCNLHSATWGDQRPVLEAAYCPTWDDGMTERACNWFARSSDGDEIRSRLMDAQQRCQTLFAPQCCLSGDPNPTNWRVREDGSLVLIDWERFCYGSPAIDLAITLPGLGSEDGYIEKMVAGTYAEFWNQTVNKPPLSVPELSGQIRIAKTWSVVEFIANAELSTASYPKETVTFIVGKLPDLLRSMAR